MRQGSGTPVRIEVPVELVEEIETVRDATYRCDFDEADRMTKRIGDAVVAIVSKNLHGMTYKNNPDE